MLIYLLLEKLTPLSGIEGKPDLSEGAEYPGDPEMIVIGGEQGLIIPVLKPGDNGPGNLACNFIPEFHAKELKDHLIGMNKPPSNVEIVPEMSGLLLAKLISTLVEPGLKKVRTEPLDVTVIGLELDVIAPPVFVHQVDEGSVGGGRHLVEVELYVGHVDECPAVGSRLCR